MQALVSRSTIGPGCVIEPAAKVINVNVPPNRYVPAGTVLTQQADADNLPAITADYPFRQLNADVVRVNTALAHAYNQSRLVNP